jgi:hypothetical protein
MQAVLAGRSSSATKSILAQLPAKAICPQLRLFYPIGRVFATALLLKVDAIGTDKQTTTPTAPLRPVRASDTIDRLQRQSANRSSA